MGIIPSTLWRAFALRHKACDASIIGRMLRAEDFRAGEKCTAVSLVTSQFI